MIWWKLWLGTPAQHDLLLVPATVNRRFRARASQVPSRVAGEHVWSADVQGAKLFKEIIRPSHPN